MSGIAVNRIVLATVRFDISLAEETHLQVIGDIVVREETVTMTMQKIVPMRISMTLMILLSMMRNWYVFAFFKLYEHQIFCVVSCEDK